MVRMEPRVFRPGGTGKGLAQALSVRGHPHRLNPAAYHGYRAYSLTICTHNRIRPFTDDATVAMTVLQILRVAADQHVEVLAYCVMPDHIHAIVIAHAETSNLERFVRVAKQRSGYAFRQVTGRRLWQESYFDRTVRNVQELPSLVEYMIRNPVRAGLVGDPADYAYWGSERYSREELLEFVMSGRRR
jgi:REP element-mobilizing transposase RayT